MRHFLVVVQRIVAANQAGDMPAVATAAASAGLKAHQADFADPGSLVHSIRRKAPKEFFPLGKATHEAFDEIASVATAHADKDAVNRLLATTCSAVSPATPATGSTTATAERGRHSRAARIDPGRTCPPHHDKATAAPWLHSAQQIRIIPIYNPEDPL